MRYILLLVLSGFLTAYGQDLDPKDIMMQLISGRGINYIDYPDIVVSERMKNIAAYSPVQNKIIIEAKAYDICKGFGNKSRDALAFIIAHELTHFYQERLWSTGAGEVPLYMADVRLKQLREVEYEADSYGAFLCYLAGFDYRGSAPAVIHALYEAYELNDSVDEYMNAETRAAITMEVCEQVGELQMIFEAAHTLDYFGEYKWSEILSSYLLKYLNLPEIYFNLGLMQLKQVLATSSEGMVLPLQVIKQLSLRNDQVFDKDALLSSARQNLTLSIQNDPFKIEAFLGLAALYLIQGDLERYREIVDGLGDVSMTTQSKGAIEIMNIIYGHNNGHIKDAKREFRLLANDLEDSWLREVCNANIEILSGRKSKPKKDLLKHYFPKEKLTLSSAKVVDSTDPAFPRKMMIHVSDEMSKIVLSTGDQKVTLWRLTEKDQAATNYDNQYEYQTSGIRYKWYAQGLEKRQ